MSPRRSELLFVLLVAVAGCADKAPRVLQVYDAATGEPLAGVRVERWDWTSGWSTDDPPVLIHRVNFHVPGHTLTRVDGLVISDTPAERFPTYMFYKDGYGPAEAHLDGQTAFVASPSEGNRFRRWWFSRPMAPTRYQSEQLPLRPLVRVPMWPTK
jgi:hypothetical protein